MGSIVALAKSHPRSLTLHAAVGAVGLVLVIDGLLRGEIRHQAVAVAMGALLMLPILVVMLGGERALKLCNGLLFSVATLALLLVGLEVSARAFDLRMFTYPEVVADPVLGHAYVPNRGGHDDWGHRNRYVPEKADVVCIGDSQTFGTSIQREDNYSSELARFLKSEVYNMSVGGYGPLQYVELAKRSLALKPDVVTIGYYFGNDLADAHRFLGLEHWATRRDPELSYPIPNDVNFGDKRSLNFGMAIADGLMLHSLVLRRIGNHMKLAAKLNPRLHGIVGSNKGGTAYESGEISTRLEPGPRIGCMDLSLDHLKDGLKVTERCFAELRTIFTEADVEPFVLLIHNKEFYYHELMRRREEAIPKPIARLAELEVELTKVIVDLATSSGMTVVDPSDELIDALGDGLAIFPPDVDGHLNRTGSEIAGRALGRAIEGR